MRLKPGENSPHLDRGGDEGGDRRKIVVLCLLRWALWHDLARTAADDVWDGMTKLDALIAVLVVLGVIALAQFSACVLSPECWWGAQP